MAENNQTQNSQNNHEQIKAELTQKVERQKKLIAELEKSIQENPSDEQNLQLLRERDTLRHFLLMQKPDPRKRAEAKSNYAANSAMNRAVEAGRK